jgi:hypothetical protein
MPGTSMKRIAAAVETIAGNLGSTLGAALTADPASYNTVAADSTLVVGGLYRYATNGWIYRYVQFKDAVTYAAGQSVEWANTTGTAVTNDRSGGSSVGRAAAGVALAVMTADYYGFVLVNGFYATLKTSGADDIAAQETLITHATTDGTCDGVTSWTLGCFGVALAADDDTANTVAGYVMVL